MVTTREMNEEDMFPLMSSLASDAHHFETPVAFFQQPGTLTSVYEDEQGTICFARVTSSLRLDIHFMDNGDKKRNASVLTQEILPLIEKARNSGYTEICFTTNVERLKDFCVKVFGFEVVPDTFVLRKYL